MTDIFDSEPYVYDHVPTLRELLPQEGGQPGVTYGIIVVANQKQAQNGGWGGVEGTKAFTIEGPTGRADCGLVCKGSLVKGMSANGGARHYLLDHDIYRLTGLWLGKLPPELEAETSKTTTKPKSKPTPSSSGDGYDGLPA